MDKHSDPQLIRVSIIEAANRLVDRAQDVLRHLTQNPPQGVIFEIGSETPYPLPEGLRKALLNIYDYDGPNKREDEEGLDRHHVFFYPGWLMVDPEGMAKFCALNETKEALEVLLRAGDHMDEHGNPIQYPFRREQQTLSFKALVLAKMHTLNRKQALRQFRCLDATPKHLGFYWDDSRKIYNTSAAQVIDTLNWKLERSEDTAETAQIEADIATIEGMADRALAQIKAGNRHIRTNVLFRKQAGEKRARRKVVPSNLPLILPCTDEAPSYRMPEVSPEEQTKHKGSRKKWQDVSIIKTYSVVTQR